MVAHTPGVVAGARSCPIAVSSRKKSKKCRTDSLGYGEFFRGAVRAQRRSEHELLHHRLSELTEARCTRWHAESTNEYDATFCTTYCPPLCGGASRTKLRVTYRSFKI